MAAVATPLATEAPAPDVTLVRFLRRTEQNRSQRRRLVRPHSVTLRHMTQEQIALGAALHPPVEVERPKTRADCANVPRPCPFVSCVHHLYLEVSEKGSVKYMFPDLEPDELEESCSLDVADSGGATYEAVGDHLNMTRERVRQIEAEAMAEVRDGVAHLREEP